MQQKSGVEVPGRPSCGATIRDSFVGAFKAVNSRAIIVVSIVFMVLYSTINVSHISYIDIGDLNI